MEFKDTFKFTTIYCKSPFDKNHQTNNYFKRDLWFEYPYNRRNYPDIHWDRYHQSYLLEEKYFIDGVRAIVVLNKDDKACYIYDTYLEQQISTVCFQSVHDTKLPRAMEQTYYCTKDVPKFDQIIYDGDKKIIRFNFTPLCVLIAKKQSWDEDDFQGFVNDLSFSKYGDACITKM